MPKILDSPEFLNELVKNIEKWEALREKYNHNVVKWWEHIVKPGLRELAIMKTKDRNTS